MPTPALDVFHALDTALASAVALAAPATVHVGRGVHRGHRSAEGGGTGIVWSDDLVVTSSFHTPDRTTVGVPLPDGNLDLREAEVIGRDPGTDIAVLRVQGGGLTPAAFRELDGLAVGNLAFAVGRPGKTARASLRAIGVLGPEVATPRGGRLERYVESDRQIPRGFAGGPLIDAGGAVIGLNTRTVVRGADLAVPTVTLRRVVEALIKHGGVLRGYLGVGAYQVVLPSAHARTLGREHGALLASLEEDGAASRGGLLLGDILLALDGVAILGPESLRDALAGRADKLVIIEILRAGQLQQLSLTLGHGS
jgi:serine protease DegQ